MTETKYYYLTSAIKQMNTTFNIVLATTNPDESIQHILDDTKHHIEMDLHEIDDDFSIEKKDSMVSKFQKGDQDPLINSEPFQLVYDKTIIAEQMTQHYYSAYFNGKYDPTGIIKGWAMERLFDSYLKPLLSIDDIEGVSFKSGENIKLATRRNSDYRWSVNINKPNTDTNLSSYYLQNGAIATVNNLNFEKVPRSRASEMEQVTILSGDLTDSVVWANAGISAGTELFPEMIVRADLTGMFVDKKLGIVNFRDGSVSTNKKIFLK
ncbi:FAD:protein FMN transferase [Companilactobacillus jidongensis]|uniref:FAD:protein FMN transferase n=1 Tax=Companilactobacillus jidongensis TaxID=2486006 RepID=UPI000F7820EF|nr:FAD:protein FMN transferase [Companilactobacillus jidongensis]